eukprot:545766-Pelagomonas_calceolata.AAC.1
MKLETRGPGQACKALLTADLLNFAGQPVLALFAANCRLSPLYPDTLMVGMELRLKVSEYVRERIVPGRAELCLLNSSIPCYLALAFCKPETWHSILACSLALPHILTHYVGIHAQFHWQVFLPIWRQLSQIEGREHGICA